MFRIRSSTSETHYTLKLLWLSFPYIPFLFFGHVEGVNRWGKEVERGDETTAQ